MMEKQAKTDFTFHFSTILIIHSLLIHKFSMWIAVYNVENPLVNVYFTTKIVENLEYMKILISLLKPIASIDL